MIAIYSCGNQAKFESVPNSKPAEGGVEVGHVHGCSYLEGDDDCAGSFLPCGDSAKASTA